uniref:Reverse transcriptase/retrotransposon-derived protein RNase H-like domain-containing protein n=1 Tax=Urocitellus parryii TaxID=9999 RepID=A0A8D2H9Z5_UROPR
LALGVLGQNKGPIFAPVAYLSKQLEPTVREWAPFLRALAAVHTLLQETNKLTFGAQISSFPFTLWRIFSLTKA